MSVAGVLAKYRALDRERRQLLLTALIWLAMARLTIVFLPFPTVARLASVPLRKRPPPAPERELIVRNLRWAITAASSRAAWRALCFEQGLAAHFMLRRRGIPSTLYFGAAPGMARGLTAHVWVRDGERDVVGTENAEQFALLAAFPDNAKQ